MSNFNISLIVGLVVVAILFISFYTAFGLPQRNYVPQENLDRLADIGKNAVKDARVDVVGQAFFIIGTLLELVVTIFNFITVGLTSMVLDIGGIFGVPPSILLLIIGVVILVAAYKAALDLRGTTTNG